LKDKVAVVVGSARGIGAASAAAMAAEGASVVLVDIDGAAVEAKAEEIRASGGPTLGIQGDIANEDDVQRAIEAAVSTFGGVDILHANAAAVEDAVMGPESAMDAARIPLSVWDRTMAVNLRGYLLAARAALPEMLKRNGGAVVFTSSDAAFASYHIRGAYSTSKAALIGLTRHLAAAYGKQGVRVNSICPGLIVTGSVTFTDEHLKIQLRHHLTPRLGRPEDIANTAVFLASDEAGFITGQAIQVDGGLLAHIPQWAELVDGPIR